MGCSFLPQSKRQSWQKHNHSEQCHLLLLFCLAISVLWRDWEEQPSAGQQSTTALQFWPQTLPYSHWLWRTIWQILQSLQCQDLFALQMQVSFFFVFVFVFFKKTSSDTSLSTGTAHYFACLWKQYKTGLSLSRLAHLKQKQQQKTTHTF